MKGIRNGLVATTMVGGTVPVSGLLVDYPLFTGQAARYLVGAGFLAVFMAARRVPFGRLAWSDAPALAGVAGLGMLGFSAAMINAQAHAEPGLVAAVLGGSPLVLALVGPLLADRKPALWTVCGAVVVATGVVTASGGGSWSGPGLLLAVLTMLAEVAFTLFAVKPAARLGGLSLTFWSHLLAGLGGVVVAAFIEVPRVPTAVEGLSVVVVAVLAVCAATFWFSAVGDLGAARAGVLVGAMPVAGLAVSLALGLQEVRLASVAGAVLVGLGCVIGLSDRRAPSAARPEPHPVGTP